MCATAIHILRPNSYFVHDDIALRKEMGAFVAALMYCLHVYPFMIHVALRT